MAWETKRTRTWSDGWLNKLKGDQRAAKADLALIVSHALPKDIETFGHMDGVWVTGPKCAVPVATSLRESLILMSSVRAAGEGQQTKSALMYDYLTGPRFRHRIEAVVENRRTLPASAKRRSSAGRNASSSCIPSWTPPPVFTGICRGSPDVRCWRSRFSKPPCWKALTTIEPLYRGSGNGWIVREPAPSVDPDKYPKSEDEYWNYRSAFGESLMRK